MDTVLHPLVDRPGRLCSEIEQAYPRIFRFIEKQRMAHAKSVAYPNWAYSTTEIIVDLIIEYGHLMINKEGFSLGREDAVKLVSDHYHSGDPYVRRIVSKVYNLSYYATSLSAWRMGGKHVLVFHEEVLDELLSASKVDESVPASVILQLPYWGGYIPIQRSVFSSKEQHSSPTLMGIFFTLLWEPDQRPSSGSAVLVIAADIENSKGSHIVLGSVLPIKEDLSVQQIIDESVVLDNTGATTTYESQAKLMLSNLTAQSLQLILYLCAANAEARLATPPHLAAPPRPNRPQREKLFAPQQTTVWAVGYRVGNAIRAAREVLRRTESSSAPTGRTVRPHIRRAHWHGYRVGPKRSGWKVIWIPPTPVGFPEDADVDSLIDLLPTTQRGVEIPLAQEKDKAVGKTSFTP